MKKHIGPLLLLILIVAVIAIRNYTTGIFLTGWDNLHPEFDFALNIKRSFFAIWQEYQGLGLLGGMGHAADLPRQLILWSTSLLLPVHLLRWSWTFLMLLAGPLGVYALVHSINQYRTRIDNNNAAAKLLSITPWAALTGAIFYLFNLATVQVFTAPFDAFVTHYGVLPWLLWSNWKFLHTPSRKTLLVIALINVIGMTQGLIPTLFLVYLILLASSCLSLLLHSWNKTSLLRIVSLGIVTFSINAFWLLPFTYFTLTKSSVTVNAKINQMATDEIYLQNKAFGDIGSVATLKSYWYDTADYNPTSGTLEPVLGFWRELERINWITWVRYTLAALILFGGIIAFSKKHTRVWGFLGILAIGMVAVDTPPFVWIIDWLRIHVPLFSQFFRFPFTKWGIALALLYSVWLGIGVSWIVDRLQTRKTKILPLIVVVIPMMFAVIGSIGMLQGHLISPKFKLTIPSEYFQLFTNFKTLPPGRIANLPQNTFWGWTYYRWGYSGSGFLWYGIENPIMDRAFDVWSAEGEQYYWELSRALYSKDAAAVTAVVTKYDVRYILLDENIVSPSSDRGLFIGETKELLAQMQNINEIARFGKLTVYEKLGDGNQTFVSLKSNLPTVSPAYRWTDNDVAFTQLGDYIVRDNKQKTISNTDYIYPFRSLFTKRSIDEREFRVTETPDAITIGSIVEATSASILKSDALVYDSTRSADLTEDNVKPCGVLREGTATAENFDQFLRFTSRAQRGCLSFGVGNLSHREGYLVAVESRHLAGRPMLFSLINQTAKHVELETYLESSVLRPTSYFILPPLASDGLGYTVYLSNDAIGRQETVNDIKSIKFYRIPYQELVTLRSAGVQPQPQGRALPRRQAGLSVEKVDHPNPAYYKIRLKTQDVGRTENQTLVLSQSFDPGWKAYAINSCQLSAVSCQLKNKLQELLPFLFGTEIKDHVLVNNWENGWVLKPTAISCQPSQPSAKKEQQLQAEGCKLKAVIFFLPQLLQWLGFALLPLPFLWVWYTKKNL